MSISAVTRKLLALSMLGGVGPATLRKIALVENLAESSPDVLASRIPALAKALASVDAWPSALEEAEKQIDAAAKSNALILSSLDSDYPSLLAATKDDPFLIFVRGTLATNSTKSVAVIGTRQPTPHGEVIAKRVTEFFVEQQWSVVSGLALGCDALAHRAALDAGGHTVAVLAHGLQTIAPSQHRKLADEILEKGGALISEYRFGQGALPQQFVKRDRTQAGLAQGVVMIQSDVKGGSLHASRAALDYGRWLAVPLPTPTDRRNEEPKVQANLLIAEGGLAERASLLKCHQSRLSGVIVLKTKDDYPQMIAASCIEAEASSSNKVSTLPAGAAGNPQSSDLEACEQGASLSTSSELGLNVVYKPEESQAQESTAENSVDLFDFMVSYSPSNEVSGTQVSRVEAEIVKVDPIKVEEEQVEGDADSSEPLTLQHRLL
jgi:DNA processing protein